MNFLCFKIYEGCLEMIWTHPVGKSFIILRLKTDQLLAQDIPLLGLYIAAISLGPSGWLHGTIL